MSWADLTDVRTYYEIDGSGEPLMLVPGLGCTLRDWDPLVEPLADRFTLIRADHRGMGLSEAKRPAHTLHHYSADMLEFLEHLDLKRTHILGLSLGGIIAQRFAMDHPSRVHHLVLMSCGHRFGPYLTEMARFIGSMLRWMPRKAFHRAMALIGTGPRHVDQHDGYMEQCVRESGARSVPRKAIARQLRSLAASNPAPGELAKITAPTLVIAGEYDGIIPPCYGRQMADAIPDARFMLVPDAGHNPLLESPDHVVEPMVRFLRSGDLEPLAPMDANHASTGQAAA